MKPERWTQAGWAALVACAIAFALGLSGLFQDRLETGDIYPPGSTLRSDPLGARALYEALDRYPGVEASRAYARADLRGVGPGDAVFFLALDPGHPPGPLLAQMDTLARAGARAVGVFRSPDSEPREESKAEDTSRVSSGSLPDSAVRKPVKITRVIREESLPAWGFRIQAGAPPDSGKRPAAVALAGTPDSLTWLGTAWFDSLAPEWRVLYRAGGRPVVIDRDLGLGSVALASDGYFASNEAQLEAPPAQPAKLAALLVGKASRIRFDERHLGVRKDDGMADLLIRHRIHLVLPSLLLLLGLFLWNARARRGPVFREVPEAGSYPDPRSALAALLKRTLGYRGVLENCLKLWTPAGASVPKAVPASGLAASGEAGRIQEVLAHPPSGPQPLAAAYGSIQSILHPRKPT